MVVLMDYTQEVQLLVLLVVFKYLELLVILEKKTRQILHMVFIKSLELYKVLLMEYNLMVILKVMIQLIVMVFI